MLSLRRITRYTLEAMSPDGLRRFVSELPKNLSLDGVAPQTWVTVTKIGKFYDPRYSNFEITKAMLLAMIDNFNKQTYGQEIFLDVAHTPSDGAAAKFLKLALEGTKLRALLEWTPFGVDAVKNRGFKYLSADYTENFQDNEKRDVHGPLLFGAGLTIRPVIKGLDPVQLSEPDGTPPTFLHPELQSKLLQEITDMKKKILAALKAKCDELNLDTSVSTQLATAMGGAIDDDGDEKKCQEVLAQYVMLAESVAKQVGDKPATLSITVPNAGKTLSEADVRALMHAEAKRLHEEKLATEQGRQANVKLLFDTINVATGIDEASKKELAESVADLITPEMSADQVKRLAENQIAMGNKVAAAKQLSAMGFHRPGASGSVHITVDSSNEVKALQEHVDRRLGFASMPDARRFSNTGGQLQTANKELAEKVLAMYDAANGHRLHAEHKLLAAGDSLAADISVPASYERAVIREALYGLVGTQFVDVGTMAFAAVAQIPYSYRDTAAASLNSTRVYEGGSIPRGGMKQTFEEARPIPQKLAFEVSDELRYLTSNGAIDWDAVAENARNSTRIIGEDTERLIFNEVLQASDQYAAAAVATESVATADGTKTIFKLAHFPVLHPKKIYDLAGSQVGSTLYPIVIKSNSVAIAEYDGTGTQGAGLHYTMDFNLGEIHFVTELGAPSAPTNTHAIEATSYSYATNVFAFDTDLGTDTVKVKWDDFLYRYGLRKNVIESDRYHKANFGLMSGTIRTQIEQAGSFVESMARNGTNLDTQGNLGMVKDVPNFRTTAPGLYMGDQRIVIGERAQTRYRMMKPWAMGQLQDQRDANGRFTGKKEAYGDQFVILHTPTQLKAACTSLVLYSSSARVNR